MSTGKARVYDNKVTHHPSVDLILFDCQENLPVPGVSFPATHVPTWNSDIEYEAIAMAFFFAEKHLQDHGCIVIFHSWSADAKGVIAGLCESYPTFVKKKEWMGMNRVHLTSALDKTTTVNFSQLFTIYWAFDIVCFCSFISNVYMVPILTDFKVWHHPLGERPWQERKIEFHFQALAYLAINAKGKSRH
jgi:hypothetical protein